MSDATYLAFDIGANCGRKTWAMRQLGAKVVAVDPLLAFQSEFVPEFFWRWSEDPMVLPVARAVSTERTVELAINRFMPYVSSTDKNWMTKSAHAPKFKQPYYVETSLIRRKVQGITLDALINVYGSPRFMKVDVEGAEDLVMGTLSQPVPAFNMEFHQDWIPTRAIRHMEAMGTYIWNYALGNQGQFVLVDWVTSKQLLAYLKQHLTKDGNGSWGDIYGWLVE